MTHKSSILEEILNRDESTVLDRANVKTRGDHLIVSAINLIEEIRGVYGDDVCELLERRFLAAIKNKDPSRFRFNKR